ncbi:MAG: response regulator [Candidatus Gastranaerophilales bacterium]|nr:response regulator [Candidatus Gastranaerophilales bacterium]
MIKKKILVVDDSRGWLDYHRSVLREIYGAEFAVYTANSARNGYDMIYNSLREPYDLIISDLQMELDFEPKHAGEWFIEQVQRLKEYKNTPVLIISATYNIKSIADRLEVSCLPKSIAARDLTSYKLVLEELLKI